MSTYAPFKRAETIVTGARFDTQPYRSWFKGRLANADGLGRQPHSSLFDVNDAEVILCCALAAAAADTWPGRRLDERRFVEFLVEYARNAKPSVTCTSIPLLHAQLRMLDKRDEEALVKWKAEAQRMLEDKINQATDGTRLRLRWDEIDETHDIVVGWLMNSSIEPKEVQKKVRKATYAAIIYSDLRCGLVHELRWMDRLGRMSFDPSTEPHYVNYFDQTVNPWRLCFPYEYLRRVVEDAMNAACDWLDTSREFIDERLPTRPRPSCWWAEGR